MRSRHCHASLGFFALLVLGAGASSARADVFQEKIEPFAKKYCQSCHNKKQAKGELDLTRFLRDGDVTSDFRRWNHVVEFIRKGEMPPGDHKNQPTLEERNAVVGAVEAILLVEAKKHAGDPGVVLPRRLSNTEYDLSIRDLTGVTIQATKEFPVDPAGGEGFNNTGEVLAMTPNLLNKYLGAAQLVSDHLVLKPNGVTFAPFPVTSYAERTKLTEQAIIDFYRRHDVRLGDYLEAAWRFRHRGAIDRGVSLEEWAARRKLSGKYLALVAKTLDEAKAGTGFLKQLGVMWDAIPGPTKTNGLPPEFGECERFIAFLRGRLNQKEPGLIKADAGNWPISHLAHRAKVAAGRDKFDPSTFSTKQTIKLGRLQAKKGAEPEDTVLYLRVDPAFDAPAVVVFHRPLFSKSDNLPKNKKDLETQGVESLRTVLEREAPEVAKRLGFGKHPRGGELDSESFAVLTPIVVEIPLSPAAVKALQGKQLLVECELDVKSDPEAAVQVQHAIGTLPAVKFGANVELLLQPGSKVAQNLTASAQRFCAAFPNRFFYVDGSRGLAAGFHLVEGFFRDDLPLVNTVLTEGERKELDLLWKELDFVTQSVETLLRGFVWFERAERHVLHDKRFDFLRSEDPLLVHEEMLAKFERLYLEKLGVKLVNDGIKPQKPSPQFDLIHGFFEQTRAGLAEYQQTLAKAEAPALADLERLAERAYCRPLRPEEAKSLRGLYQQLRKQGQGIEASLRGTFTAVLMSPHFFYRVPVTPPGQGVHPLTDDAMARRLSYFLWSSLPDEELLKTAGAGKLQDDAALRVQVRRMMKDSKIEAFSREFFGQWLRYRDYLAKDTIPANTFPGYDPPLREAFFEEPTRLITHLLQQDAAVDELLHSDATFVNDPLARFYGGAIETQFRKLFAERGAELQRKGLATQRDPKTEWHRVEGLRSIGRGGLFGMPVILARNSVGQRTSPVKRGFWVVHHVLGQHFPPPPPDVPELPKSEKESAKTIREMLAQHTTNRSCAMCHVHFDGLGLTMEGFDAIGRTRTKDLAGRDVQIVGPLPPSHTPLPEGEGKGVRVAEGISGLIDYIEKQRREEFERNLCRKLLGYALGRSVVLSDEPLLQEMQKNLRAERRFSVIFETVVLSPQFRRQRGRDNANVLNEHEKAVAGIKKRGGQLTEEIKGGKRVVKVDMKGTEILGNELDILDGLIGLEELDLRATFVNGAGLVHLKSHKALKRLYLSNVELGDRPLVHLKGMPALEELQLGVTGVTDKDLADLAESTSLKKLNLFSNSIGDVGIEHLKALTSLEWLDLYQTDVGDAGLTSLKQLKNLEYLDLFLTNVTDNGLNHLANLSRLREVHLNGTSVSKAGVDRLQRSLPKTRIVFTQKAKEKN